MHEHVHQPVPRRRSRTRAPSLDRRGRENGLKDVDNYPTDLTPEEKENQTFHGTPSGEINDDNETRAKETTTARSGDIKSFISIS